MVAPKDYQASCPPSDLPLASHQLVNVHQAKTHLSQLLQQVEQGQEVVMRGQIKLADDFDAPLDGLFEALP
jgi:hypothetical protein